DLFAMQYMRRRQNDSFDLRIGERICVVGCQGDALLVTKRARCLEIRLDGATHADVRRRPSKHIEHFLAPPAHADEGDSDRPAHIQLSSRLLNEAIERSRPSAGPANGPSNASRGP